MKCIHFLYMVFSLWIDVFDYFYWLHYMIHMNWFLFVFYWISHCTFDWIFIELFARRKVIRWRMQMLQSPVAHLHMLPVSPAICAQTGFPAQVQRMLKREVWNLYCSWKISSTCASVPTGSARTQRLAHLLRMSHNSGVGGGGRDQGKKKMAQNLSTVKWCQEIRTTNQVRRL